MEQTIKLEMTKEEASLLSAVIEQCLKTIREAIERMDQAEAERLQLQSETRVMLDQLRTMFNAETVPTSGRKSVAQIWSPASTNLGWRG